MIIFTVCFIHAVTFEYELAVEMPTLYPCLFVSNFNSKGLKFPWQETTGQDLSNHIGVKRRPRSSLAW